MPNWVYLAALFVVFLAAASLLSEWLSRRMTSRNLRRMADSSFRLIKRATDVPPEQKG